MKSEWLIVGTIALIFGAAGWNLVKGGDGTWSLLIGLYAFATPMILGAAMAGWLGYLAGALVSALFVRSFSKSLRRRS